MTAPAARRPWTRAQLAVAAAGLTSVAAGVLVYVAWVLAAGQAQVPDRAWTAAQQLLSGAVWVLTGRLQVQGARLRRETLRELER